MLSPAGTLLKTEIVLSIPSTTGKAKSSSPSMTDIANSANALLQCLPWGPVESTVIKPPSGLLEATPTLITMTDGATDTCGEVVEQLCTRDMSRSCFLSKSFSKAKMEGSMPELSG
jgi:hypothetical protein